MDRPGAEQSTIRLGLPAPDPSHEDYLPLTVVDTLLGGAFMSAITLNLREDKGYTYSPRSTIAVHYRDAYWMHASDVTTAHTGDSLHEIFAEIDRLRAEPPSVEELEGVQRFMAGGMLVRNATPAGLLGQLGFLDFTSWARATPSGTSIASMPSRRSRSATSRRRTCAPRS